MATSGKGTSCRWRAASGAKACTTLSTIAYQKKNAKHIHTAGIFRKPSELSAAAAPLTGAVTVSVNLSRLTTSTASTTKASTPAQASATRHEKAKVSGTSMAGASAQP